MNYKGTECNFKLVCDCGGTDIQIESSWCDDEAEIKLTCQSCNNEVDIETE